MGLKCIIGSPMGKFHARKKIISYFPDHKIYVEPFGGSGAVLLGKKPSEVEVYNDIDEYWYFVFKFVKNLDEETFKRLKKLNWYVATMKKWEEIKAKVKQKDFKDDIDKFHKLILWRYFSVNKEGIRYRLGKRSRYDISKLPKISERLKNVKIYNKDWSKIVDEFDSNETFFYFDPPYKGSKKDKTYGVSRFSFEDFIERLKKIKGRFIVSYSTDLIADFRKNGWYIKKIGFQRIANVKAEDRRLEYELLVFNFKPEKNDLWIFSEDLDVFSIDFPEFVVIPDFISITGSTLYGSSPKDIDLVLKVPQGLFDYIFFNYRDLIDALVLKLERIFNQGKTENSKRIHLIPSSVGANWDHLPIYDLVLKPKDVFEIEEIDEPDFKDIAINYYQQLRVKNPELAKQAEISKTEDKIELFRFFYPLKTKYEAVIVKFRDGNPNIDELLSYMERIGVNPEDTIIQKKYDGARMIIMVDNKNKKYQFISDDGTVVPNKKFKNVIKELSELSLENAIFDSELEIWKEGYHLNREEVSAFLHRKQDTNDSGIVFNIFDVLYLNGQDLHKIDVKERIKLLDKLAFRQSTIVRPNTKYHLNLTPSYEFSKENILKLLDAPYSEGVMIKWNEYSLTGRGTYLKYKKYEELKVIILEKYETKTPGVFNYDIGIAIEEDDEIDESKIVELNGKKFMHIGKTYNTKLDLKQGNIISVRFHTLNLYRSKSGKQYLHIYEPIVIEHHPEEIEPDFFKEVIKQAEISGLLSIKNFIENLPEYDPKTVQDKVLLDDHRILQAYLSSENTRYPKRLIEEKLIEVWKEMLRRGMKLHPEEWKNERARELFLSLKTELFKSDVDEFLITPDENKEWKYVLQAHFRGSSVHFDLRLERENDLLGWTLLVQLEDALSEPVLTFEQAKKVLETTQFKLDLKTGKPLKRKIESGIIRQAEIRAIKKAPEPKEWLNYQGVSPPKQVGATANYPGIFVIIDTGIVEYGAKKPGFYEYFFQGKVLKGRYVFRAILRDFKEDFVLPPAEEEEQPRENYYYVMIKPKNEIPYVLSKRSIKKNYSPEKGKSEVPKNIREQIPDQYQYWKAENPDEVRVKLIENLKEIVEFREGNLKLWRIWWKRYTKDGTPVIVIRWGPSTEVFLLKLDNRVFECEYNPLYTDTLAVERKLKTNISRIKNKILENNSELNPTKNTRAKMELLESQQVNILENGIDFLKFVWKNNLIVGRRLNDTFWEFRISDIDNVKLLK